MGNKCKILTMDVDVVDLQSTTHKIMELVAAKKGAFVCVSNVHMCMETYDSLEFRNIVNSAQLVIPDGRPISWGQKLLGHPNASQVRGQDITNALCGLSETNKLKIGLYGGSSKELLDLVKHNLNRAFPAIDISFDFSPPFRALTEEEDVEVVKTINDAQVDILLVGIGCPKQEIWMHEHKDSLNCVMLGVGAAFDFIAGSKKHAPIWMQKLGLEWLFRLTSEPRRLWKRYLKQNPRFIFYFARQLLFK